MVISFSNHMVAPAVFYANQPPHTNVRGVAPEVRQFVPAVCADVATQAGAMSMKNAPRMGFYNLISRNNYDNELFEEAVVLVLNEMAYGQRHRRNVIGSTDLGELTRNVLSLLMSEMVMSEDFREIATPALRSSLASNIPILRQLREEADSMLRSTQPVKTAASKQAFAPVVNKAEREEPVDESRAAQRPQRPPSVPVEEAKPAFPVQRQAKQQEKQPSASTPSKLVNPKSYLVKAEIENMNREEHSLVYASYKVPANTKQLSDEWREASLDLAEIERVGLEHANIRTDLVATECLENFLASVRSEFLDSDEGRIQAYSACGVANDTLLFMKDQTALMVRLSEQKTFAGITEVLGDVLAECLQDTSRDHRATLMAISQIDRRLTRAVSEFVDFVSCGALQSIDSFMEDVTDVAPWLGKNTTLHRSVWTRFEKAVMENLFTVFEDAEGDSTASYYSKKNVSSATLAMSYGVMYVSASSKELGLTVTRKTGEVHQTTTPKLYSLLDAARRIHERRFMPAINLMVTSDDQRIRFTYLEEGVFAVKEI